MFFIGFLSFCTTFSYAQKDKTFDFYASLDLNAGNYYGFDFALNTILVEKISIKVGLSNNVREPKDIPDDFGLFYKGIGMITPNYNPKEFQQSYEFLLGRVFEFKNIKSVRILVHIGIGDVKLTKPTNYKKLEYPPDVGHQYSFSYYSFKSVHFIFNPRIEFPFTNFYGLSISPILKIGNNSNFYGIGIGHIFGKIR
ncbi:hypothetical protein DNU06_07840 [Putridiphycobacter roseus]|uniref:Outer membrane protein beta-barrel domain-containing protein n=2 Tax=Putridiphycobacter roseus TaxID=2219161 RepID=A0A2W1NQ31_9FLAO|nr:hypothetical protein DNU06_07840 [Putridiphycobacter roseus]